MALKVLIIDDENKTRSLIAKMVGDMGFDLEVFTDGQNLKTGLKAIKTIKPDIVLLDIQMPDGTGFDLLQLVDEKTFQVIFISAHEEFAIRAIKCAALDYILKPIDEEELKTSIERAISEQSKGNQLNKNYSALDTNISKGHTQKLVLKTQESVYLIDISEIIRCESDRNYTTFFLDGGRKILTSRTLKDYDGLILNQNFIRCHRSHIINMDFFDRYDRSNGGMILMKDKSEVPLARASKDSFFKFLESM